MSPPPAQSGNASPVKNPWLIAIAVMLATFMEVLDTSIAAVALPISLAASRRPTTKLPGY